MKSPLSNFIKYKNSIDLIEFASDKELLEENLSKKINGLKKFPFDEEVREQIEKEKQLIVNSFNGIQNLLDRFKADADDYVRQKEKTYIMESYNRYEESSYDTPEYLLNRAIKHDLTYADDDKHYFKSRIKSLSSWKHSAMFVRPGHGDYIKEIIDSDPLYLIDEHEEMFDPVRQMWTKQYQGRLRYNLIDENREQLYRNIPKYQLGLIVAFDYFNHKPFDVIRRHLTELFDLLKPGGSLIFTYNNCNYPLAVKNFELGLYSYTPGALIEPAVELIGFEIVESYSNEDTNVSWLEVKKKGELTSIKGGQTLGIVDEKQPT